MDEIEIDSNINKLDIKLIHDFISTSYWGKGRTLYQTEKCIGNSLNFGVYQNNNQIGYGRVVTDYSTIAYILDVFIVKSARGNGYSKKLVKTILKYPELSGINVWKLATMDAQKLYEKFGFIFPDEKSGVLER